jgi:predicted alpha/beta-hydrolase family hydrolase
MKTPLQAAKEQELQIRIEGAVLRGDLTIPESALGLVIFAHGSGSGRKSSRNRFVAGVLQEHRLGTLLFDLLTMAEEREDSYTAHLRFDIPMLAHRLRGVTESMLRTHGQGPIGYFGASTGAAAALIAAAEPGGDVRAVVSRGGRPDLAAQALGNVAAPTLLIVGGEDHPVIDLNKKAFAQLSCEKGMEIVPGATHLFEERGTLERVAELASGWFVKHLPCEPFPI